ALTGTPFAAASLDTSPPKTTAAVISGTAGQNGWYTSSVTVALTPKDNPDGSGVAATYFAVDKPACSPPTSGSTVSSNCLRGTGVTAVSVPADGRHTVSFFSADQAGNIEPQQSFAVNIDQTAPTITPQRRGHPRQQ